MEDFRGGGALKRAGDAWLQGRLSVLHKLTMLMIALTAPLALAAVFYWSSTQRDVDATQRQLTTLEYHRAVWPVLAETARVGAPSEAAIAGWRAAKPAIEASGSRVEAAAFDAALARGERAAILGAGPGLLSDISNRGGLMRRDGPPPSIYVWLAGMRLPSLLVATESLSDGADETARWRDAGVYEAIAQYTIGSARGAIASAQDDDIELQTNARALIDAINQVSQVAFARAPTDDPALSEMLTALRASMVDRSDALWRSSMQIAEGELRNELDVISANRRAGIAAWLAGLALVSVLAVALARSIARPQNHLVSVMSAISTGRTDLTVPYQDYSNELGATARAVEIFRRALIERKNLEADLGAERRALEQRVAARTRALETANSAKTNFVASLAHEIRTPLNGVLGMAAALERTPLNEEQAGMVRIITSSGDVLLRLLTNAIDISRIESGKLELDVAPFDLTELVEQSAALYREAARAKGVSLHVAVAPNAAGIYRGDALRIRQVLQNLTANAVKFTQSGSVSLSVAAFDAPGSRTALSFEVADTGIGLPAPPAQLFESYSQGDRSVARRFGGTGLGLSICRDLALLMGGAISASDRSGGGAIFVFEIPLERDAPAHADSSASAPLILPGGLRVLAADDNPINLIVLRTILAQLGVNADFANGGREALDAGLTTPYDVLLLDANMPERDGLAVTRTLRATDGPNRRTPILMLSADAMPDQVARYRAAGANGHVAKPIQVSALIAAVTDALSARARPEPSAATG